MTDFDVCVIGAGPAGFAAAMRLWDFGQKVCLVERGRVGGTGVHNGALSSKTLWELSCDYRRARRRDRGYVATDLQVHFDAVMQVVEEATGAKVEQMKRQLRELAPREDGPRSGASGSITLVQGSARFVDPHTVVVEGASAGDSRRITARSFIVATGSRPRTLPELEIDGRHIITSDHIGRLQRFPRSLVVLGAGVVGCEFATIFANYGQTKVYLIDRAERILPFEDPDVARVCSTNLEAKGVTIHHRAKLVSMHVVGEEVEYTIEHHTGGRETIRVENALVSIGRVPNTNGLGLEDIGVTLANGGHVVTTDTQTSVPHVYAVGDVTLDVALVSVGEIEGRHAAERIAGQARGSLAYDNLSTIMFLDPEVAAIGLNELQAQERRIPYRVAVYNYSLVNRPIAMRATDGFVKLLTTDDDELRILGMRALGVHASTMLEAISLMIQHSRSARDLAELLHPHPAVTEGLQDCVRMLMGSSIYKPCVFQSELRLSRIGYEDAE
ncbi:dihydrolipoyl dehydrogenase family protein [Paraliomyxa miuraensis]|uniref:dihydrolipoyl dehydrogenase family protein n=1 Tax=Paraliomyxa miuraensis TaxID=376150 RepID=UPI00224F3F70|nr:NAD(P)/FAD-dependent oxidoreductase [Paraliomyxa miuraensis]MCX4239456.1 NAD(P)/FAD-dependent oxidoreductase [Paraliomyxa miuraensis]